MHETTKALIAMFGTLIVVLLACIAVILISEVLAVDRDAIEIASASDGGVPSLAGASTEGLSIGRVQ